MELLTTIGRYANNQDYQLAWVVIDVEKKSNQNWFLELLTSDVDPNDGRGLVVISDQHKVSYFVNCESFSSYL